jgi:hypothetical protein
LKEAVRNSKTPAILKSIVGFLPGLQPCGDGQDGNILAGMLKLNVQPM